MQLYLFSIHTISQKNSYIAPLIGHFIFCNMYSVKGFTDLKLKVSILILLFVIPAFLYAQRTNTAKVKKNTQGTEYQQILNLNQLGLQAAKTDSAKAWQYALQVKALAEKSRDFAGLAAAQRIFGLVQASRNHLQPALLAFNSAIQYYQTDNDLKEIGVVYSDIGLAYLAQNYRKEALNYFLKAEQAHRKTNDEHDLLADLNHIGVVYFQSGNNQKAVQYYVSAATLADKLNERAALPQIYNNIGQLLSADKNYSGAEYYFNKAITQNKAVNDHRNLGIASLNLANVYTERAEYKGAIREYNNALEAFKKSNFTKGVQVSYNNLGALALRQERFRDAIPLLENSLNISKSSKNYTGVALTQQNIAYAFMKLKEFDEATKLYNEAEQSATTYKNNASVFGEIYKHRSMLDSAMGNFQGAFSERNKYLQIKDSLLNEKLSKQINELQTKYETEKKEGQINLLNRQSAIQIINLKNQQLQLAQSKLQLSKNQLIIDQNNLYQANQRLELKNKQSLLDKKQMESQHKDIVITRNALSEARSKAELGRSRRMLALLGAAAAGLVFVVILVSRNTRLQRTKLQAEKELEKFRTEQEMLNEKLRISSELHDNIGSQLTFIHSSIQNVRVASKEKTQLILQETEEVAGNTIRDLRQTVWFINNSSFTSEDFTIRLREYLKPYQATGTTTVSIENFVPGDVVLSSVTATHLFRIVQEAINNSIKYAAATQIVVKLSKDINGQLNLCINDNGCGFNTEFQSTGFGLRNMEVRAQKSGGNLTVTSAPKQGTRIQVSVPV